MRPLTVHRATVPMERHRFGFEQPTAEAPEADRSRIGAVLVPAVALPLLGAARTDAAMQRQNAARLQESAAQVGSTLTHLIKRASQSWRKKTLVLNTEHLAHFQRRTSHAA